MLVISSSAIDSIFEKETFTLEELLNSEELLQECKAKNQKLLDFILLPENLEKLFGFLMDDTQSDDVDQRRPNYPHIVTEILCLDICDILNAIFEDSKLLDKIWSFFDAENHFAKQNGRTTSVEWRVICSKKKSTRSVFLHTTSLLWCGVDSMDQTLCLSEEQKKCNSKDVG